MRQQISIGVHQVLVPIQQDDCALGIRPRRQARRSLGAVITEDGRVCPAVELDCNHRRFQIVFDDGFEPSLFAAKERREQLLESAQVLFEQTDPHEDVYVLLVFEGLVLEKYVFTEQMKPYMRFPLQHLYWRSPRFESLLYD